MPYRVSPLDHDRAVPGELSVRRFGSRARRKVDQSRGAAEEDSSLTGKMIAIYARYSSDLQSDSSIDDQVRRCREWIEGHGGCVDDGLVFADRATSGASTDRPGYEQMMRVVTAKPRRVDVIVVEDLSRLSRSSADLFTMQRLLEFLEVRLLGVADGIDTSAEHSMLTFGMKTIVSDIYLKDLRDKTVRGLRGNAKRGLSTGGLPLGYRSVRGEQGSTIEVDEDRAALVIRIFEMYRDGNSFAAIANTFNQEGIPSPRRSSGWIHATVRAMLGNAAYVGEWQYGARRWRNVPGTNKRRPTKNAAEAVMQMSRPELRIVSDALWRAVQERLAAVRRCYGPRSGASTDGYSISGRKTPYLLTGLLTCGVCGGPMQIAGGSAAMYYRCANNVKRGTCKNKLSVREDVARQSILAELRHRLTSDQGIAHARKRIAERLGDLSRQQGVATRRYKQRVADLAQQIEQLVDAVAQGHRSGAILARLERLEREHIEAQQALAEAERATLTPIDLPSPDRLLELAFDLEPRLRDDVTKGRELLRRIFRNGTISLVPQDGFYIAKSEVLPLMLLTMRPETETPPGSSPNGVRYPPVSCAGANWTTSTAEETVPYRFTVPKPADRRKLPETWRRRGLG
jgi:DNA invertase Pin-like site-specific DNA recombinase